MNFSLFLTHLYVAYGPLAELSNKRCTCINNRCIWSKISGYNLDCGRAELGADVTPTRSRWASNNYITRCHRQVERVSQFVGVRGSEIQLPAERSLRTPVEQPKRMRSAAKDSGTGGQYVAVGSVSNSPFTHNPFTTFSNKV